MEAFCITRVTKVRFCAQITAYNLMRMTVGEISKVSKSVTQFGIAPQQFLPEANYFCTRLIQFTSFRVALRTALAIAKFAAPLDVPTRPRFMTSISTSCPEASHPPARGRNSRYLERLRRSRALSAYGIWPRLAGSGNPDQRRQDFEHRSRNSPSGPPAWSVCNRSRCTTGN